MEIAAGDNVLRRRHHIHTGRIDMEDHVLRRSLSIPINIE